MYSIFRTMSLILDFIHNIYNNLGDKITLECNLL